MADDFDDDSAVEADETDENFAVRSHDTADDLDVLVSNDISLDDVG